MWMSKWLVQARRATAVWGSLKNNCNVRMRPLMPAPPTHTHPFPRLHWVCSLKSAKYYQSEDGQVWLTRRKRLAPFPLCSRSKPQHQISSRRWWGWSGFTAVGSSGAEMRPHATLPLPSLTSTAPALGHPTGWLLPRGDQEKGHGIRLMLGRKVSCWGLPGARALSGIRRPGRPAVPGTQREPWCPAAATSKHRAAGSTALWDTVPGTATTGQSVCVKVACLFVRGKYSLPFPLLPVLKWPQKNHPNHNGKP